MSEYEKRQYYFIYYYSSADLVIDDFVFFFTQTICMNEKKSEFQNFKMRFYFNRRCVYFPFCYDIIQMHTTWFFGGVP